MFIVFYNYPWWVNPPYEFYNLPMSAHRMGDIEDFHVNTIGMIVEFVFAVFTSQISIVKKTFKL